MRLAARVSLGLRAGAEAFSIGRNAEGRLRNTAVARVLYSSYFLRMLI